MVAGRDPFDGPPIVLVASGIGDPAVQAPAGAADQGREQERYDGSQLAFGQRVG